MPGISDAHMHLQVEGIRGVLDHPETFKTFERNAPSIKKTLSKNDRKVCLCLRATNLSICYLWREVDEGKKSREAKTFFN